MGERRGKPLDTDEAIIALYRAGMSPVAIARTVHKRFYYVRGVLDESGEEKRAPHGRAIEPDEHAPIIARYVSGESTFAIAKDYGCDFYPILNVLKAHDIPRRSAKRACASLAERRAATIRDMAERGALTEEIATELGIHPRTVRRLSLDHNIPLQSENTLKGRPSRARPGSRKRYHAGYIGLCLAPDDPLYVMASQRGGYALEHRVVVARSLGRPLTETEYVHHRNGDKSDNRLENLQLLSKKHPNGVAYVCMDCGSHNVKPSDIS